MIKVQAAVDKLTLIPGPSYLLKKLPNIYQFKSIINILQKNLLSISLATVVPILSTLDGLIYRIFIFSP